MRVGYLVSSFGRVIAVHDGLGEHELCEHFLVTDSCFADYIKIFVCFVCFLLNVLIVI